MFEVALAQLRFGASVSFGLPFSTRGLERIVEQTCATQREFGAIGEEARELISGPQLDDETRRVVQARRFRKQAVRAARDTRYYAAVFERSGVDPKNMSFDDIARFPITPKDHLRDDPAAFVRRSAAPSLRATTTGTTGWPTAVHFSAREMKIINALSTLAFISQNLIEPEDIVQINIASRAVIGVSNVVAGCGSIGAPVYVAGAVSPAHTLELLTERKQLPGKRDRVSIMTTYPSYLGQLVEYGLANGYRPPDFGLRRIWAGGEVVTDGLKHRCHALFGDVDVRENYGMTELVPFGGTMCSEGHLHYDTSVGLVEVYALDGSRPVEPDEPGVVVATPLPPYRDTTILLRYNTEDVVKRVGGQLTCNMRTLPATSNLLGKKRLSVRHDGGWTLVRDVIESLESVDAVPLPARYGFWSVPGGVSVEVVTRRQGSVVRGQIADALAERGVPLRRLRLAADRDDLERPLPLRCDLRESSFARPKPVAVPSAAAEGA